MPSSVHRTKKAMFDKARKLEAQGKTVKFDQVTSQTLRKNKPVGKKKTEYILHWR